MIWRLPRLGLSLRPFSLAGAHRGESWARNSSPSPGSPQPESGEASPDLICALCAKVITEGEATVTVRHAPTTLDPVPPLLPAHARCFRNELLPKW